MSTMFTCSLISSMHSFSASTCPDITLFKHGELESCTEHGTVLPIGTVCNIFCPKGTKAEYSHYRTTLVCAPNPQSMFSFDAHWSCVNDPCSSEYK